MFSLQPHGCSLAPQLLWLCLCQVLSPSSSSHCQFLSLRNQPKCHQVFPGTLCLINSEISVFSHQPETWQKAWDILGAQDLIEGPQVHACPLSKQMMAWTHVCQRSIHLSVSRLKTLGWHSGSPTVKSLTLVLRWQCLLASLHSAKILLQSEVSAIGYVMVSRVTIFVSIEWEEVSIKAFPDGWIITNCWVSVLKALQGVARLWRPFQVLFPQTSNPVRTEFLEPPFAFQLHLALSSAPPCHYLTLGLQVWSALPPLFRVGINLAFCAIHTQRASYPVPFKFFILAPMESQHLSYLFSFL